MIYNHQWLIFKQIRAWMYHYRMSIFYCFIQTICIPFTCIKKKSTSDAFSYISVIFIFVNTKTLIININFYSFTQICQLFFNISCSSHWSYLYETFHTKLSTIITLYPLVINIKKCQMITSRPIKVLFSIICMQCSIFWSIKYAITNRKHCNYWKYLIKTFIFFR